MTKKWVAGPTQEILQNLADQISDLRRDLRELDIQMVAQQYAVQAVIGSFRVGGSERQMAIRQLEAIRDGQRRLAVTSIEEDQASARKAFHKIADYIDEIIRLGEPKAP